MQSPGDADNPAAQPSNVDGSDGSDNPFESDTSALKILLVAALLIFLFVYFVL